MIDSLLQFLLEEIAMDGDAGTSVAGLAEFIEQFYSRLASASGVADSRQPVASTSTSPAPDLASRTQKVDDAFVSFVWNTLVDQPDVRVGVLSKISAAGQDGPADGTGWNGEDGADAEMADAHGEEESAKKKGKKKKIERKPEGPTHELRILDDDERDLGRDALVDKYGAQLRVLTGEETAWVAITGSHARPTSITPIIYSVLQMISRGRDEGATAVRISKELGIEPKSVFHYLKVPQQLGIIKKFRDTEDGRWTNRALHVRYLATSPYWAVHINTEPDQGKEDEAEPDDDAAAEGGGGSQWGGDELSPISPLYLNTNKQVIRKRIVKALKRRKGHWMPHSELHTAIGLHAATSLNLRRLNTIITQMADEGIVEKILTTKTKSGGGQSRSQGLRLRNPDELRVKGEEDESAAEHHRDIIEKVEEEEDDDDDGSYPSATRSIERQILDLLMNAGSRGVTNYEISATLGNFSLRFIDTILQKLGRTALPPALADYSIHSLHETIGRLKQTRWFSLVGYLSYRRERGFPDEDIEADWKAIEESGRLGQWEDDETAGPREGQYATAHERQKRLASFNMLASVGDPAGATSNGKSGGGKQRKKSVAAAKGKAKEVRQDSPAEGSEDGDAARKPSVKKKTDGPAKPTGRPRKHPLAPGQESTYMRKKREKAEDEERERLGLPPLERPKPGRRKKADTTQSGTADGEGDDLASGSQTPAEDRPPKKGRKGKAKDSQAQDTELDDVTGSAPPNSAGTTGDVGDNDAGKAAQETPGATTAPKKRGRPPKKQVSTVTMPDSDAGKDNGGNALGNGVPQSLPPSKRGLFATASNLSSAPATSSPVKRTSRALEPYIDIDLSSPPIKRAKRTSSAVQPSGSQTVASSTYRLEEVAPVAGSSRPFEVVPEGVTGAVAEVGGTSRATSPLAASSGAASSPGPAAPSSPTSVATTIRKRVSSTRPSIVNKVNLTYLARQKELLDFIAASGGIVERTARLNEHIHAWGSAQTPPVSKYMMDKYVIAEVLDLALRGDRLRKTVASGKKGERVELYYLPTVDMSSEIARDFVKTATVSLPRPSRFAGLRAVTQADSDSEGEEPPKSREHAKKREREEAGLADPEPAHGFDVVQEYFRQQQAVLGRAHGVKYGLAARARQLHKWLASHLFAHANDPKSGIVNDGDDLIIVQHVLLDSMPLSVFLHIVPLPVESEQLDAFLDDHVNRSIPMRDLPADILAIIRPRLNKRKSAMWRCFELLLDLSLLSPLVVRADERGHASFVKPRAPKHASHWRFHIKVPLYAFADAKSPLIATATLDSNDAVAAFWVKTQGAATAKHRESVQAAHIPGFPPVYAGRGLFRREMLSVARWRETYQLAPTQRAFLCKLLQAEPEILADEHAQDLAAWARSLYAPQDVVAKYLADVQETGLPAEGGSRKRRRVKKVVVGADGVETEVYTSEDEEPRESATAVMARKRKEAAEQQEQDWQGILDRFRRDHQQPDLDATVVDWLHKKFLDPRAGNKLDAKQLDFELRRLIASDPASLSDEEPRQTIVPSSVQRRARQSKDTYAVNRGPKFRKSAPRGNRPKKVVIGSNARPVARLQRADSPHAATAGPSAGEDQPLKRLDQTAFLSEPLPPYPKLPQGKRLSRSHFSTEQDELILDAEIVILVRAKAINARVQYAALEWFFPQNPAANLAKRIRTLLKRPEDREMHDRVVAAFSDVYKTYESTVPDPTPTSLVNFDLATWIRILREKVNRRQLRLMAAPQRNDTPKAEELPGDLADLQEFYRLEIEDKTPDSRARYEKVWARYHVTTAVREDAAASGPYAHAWQDKTAAKSRSRAKDQAIAALKAVISTADKDYTEAEGAATLAPYVADVDDAVEYLASKGVISKIEREENRRVPGRNFLYKDKFLDRFGPRLDMSHMQEASHFEQDLLGSTEGIFPLAPAPGEMMAFFDLVSEGLATLSIDTTSLTEKTLDVEDYQTRQANDDDIECTINIVPASEGQKRSAPANSFLPDSIVQPASLTTTAEMDDAEAKLSGKMAQKMLQLLREAGGTSVSLVELGTRLGEEHGVNDADFAEAAATLTSAEPPLAFYAGVAELALVSALHWPDWSLAMPDNVALRFLPTFWTGVGARINAEHFQRAAGWVKGELKFHAGVTLVELVERAGSPKVLAAYEVRLVLLALYEGGKVICRDGAEGAPLDARGCSAERSEAAQIDWLRDHWFATGTFW